MKRIILSLVVIGLVGAVGVGVTRAYFTSSATSTNNTFAAGTLNLVLNTGDNDSSQTHTLFTATNIAPGDSIIPSPSTLYFRNTGTVAGKVGIAIGYLPLGSVTTNQTLADNFAKHLFITSGMVTEPGVPIAFDASKYWADHIVAISPFGGDYSVAVTAGAVYYDSVAGVYKPTLYGMTLVHQYFDNGSGTLIQWNNNNTGSVSMTLKFDTAADNTFQGAGLTATLTANMRQYSDPTAF